MILFVLLFLLTLFVMLARIHGQQRVMLHEIEAYREYVLTLEAEIDSMQHILCNSSFNR